MKSFKYKPREIEYVDAPPEYSGKPTIDESTLFNIAKNGAKQIKQLEIQKQKLNEPNVFTQHFPAYMDFDTQVDEFKDLNDILRLEYVQNFSKDKGFYGYFKTFDNSGDYIGGSLMALYNWNDEYYGCTSWWCIGHFKNNNFINSLRNWEGYTATHKMSCYSRRYKIFGEDFNCNRPDEVQKKMVSEVNIDEKLGWYHCDCGYDDIMKNKNRWHGK